MPILKTSASVSLLSLASSQTVLLLVVQLQTQKRRPGGSCVLQWFWLATASCQHSTHTHTLLYFTACMHAYSHTNTHTALVLSRGAGRPNRREPQLGVECGLFPLLCPCIQLWLGLSILQTAGGERSTCCGEVVLCCWNLTWGDVKKNLGVIVYLDKTKKQLLWNSNLISYLKSGVT